jgi:hypothetical protein
MFGGKTYMKLGGGEVEAYMKLKSDEKGEFDTFSKRESSVYETFSRGNHYLKPENDIPYHVCTVLIARSLM